MSRDTPSPMPSSSPTTYPNEKDVPSSSSSAADVTALAANAPRSTHVPHSSYASAGRPDTASSTLSNPFDSPESSRPPSLRPPSSHISFPQGLGTAANHVPRSILNASASRDSGLRDSAFLSHGYTSGARMSGLSQMNSNSVYGAVPGSTSVLRHKAPRMKSHLIKEGEEVPKPWTEGKNPRAAVSYWIVWVLFFLGIAGGAVQCYFQYAGVRLDKQPLCLVLDENFANDNPEAVFGERGTFFREVNMDGFGYVDIICLSTPKIADRSTPTPPETANSK